MPNHQHEMFFTGLIHPQSGNWRLDRPWTVHEKNREIQIFFQNSAFNVRVRFSDRHELGKDTNQDNSWLNPIWLEVESVVRSVLDSLGFVLAASLEMEMTTGRGGMFPGLSESITPFPPTRVSKGTGLSQTCSAGI